MARLAGGLVAAGLGLATLVAWVTGRMILATFGEGWIPMAPSTGLLFLLTGTTIALLPRLEARPGSRRATRAVLTGILLVALVLLGLSYQGVALDLEHPGLDITGSLESAPLGHMSPLTALAFVCGVVSLLARVARTDEAGRDPVAGIPAFLTLLVGGTLTVAYVLGGPMLYGSELIPPALTTALGFVALGTALLAETVAIPEAEPRAEHENGRVGSYLVGLAFVLATAAIVVSGWFSFRHYEQDFRGAVERQLGAVADLTVTELRQWRRERLSDAAVFSQNPSFTAMARRYFAAPSDTAVRAEILSWMRSVRQAYAYDLVLVADASGETVLSYPEDSSRALPHLAEDLERTRAEGAVSLRDIHRDPGDPAEYLLVRAPIHGSDPSAPPIGMVGLRVAAATHVYPLVQDWPVASGSAETFLVRRDGTDVLFLNDLRFRPDAALKLRIPLARSDVPAVMAVHGREGVVEGTDYRGERVVAALRAVPDTPWFLVARMDTAEVFAPLRDRLWWMVGMVGLLVFGAAVAAGLAWQRRRTAHYRSMALAEAARRESEARYRRLFEEAPVGIFTTTSSGTPLNVNSTMAEILDFDSVQEALDGYDDLAADLYVDPGRREDFLRALEEQGHVEQFQYRARTNRDRRIWIEMNARVSEWREDGSYVIEGFATEITRRKEAQEALIKNRQLLTAAQELAAVGGWEYVVDEDAVYWTDEVYRIHGLDPDDVESGSSELVEASLACYPDPARERVADAFRACVEEAEPYDLEVPFVTAGGEERWIRTVGRPVVEDGRVERVIGNIMDVTERRRADEAHDRLQTELAQAQRVEAVGRLAGGVAHDFNNMLAVILGNIEMTLAELPDDSTLREDLVEVRDAARRSADLTRQLLAFARRQTVTPEVLDPNETVEGILKMLRRLIGENIELAWFPSPDAWPVRIDPAQVDQILANLVLNARDAISGQGRVIIETANVHLDAEYARERAHVTPGDYVMIAVTDDGVGMSADVRNQVFEPFFTTKAEGEGTGLGLATVYGIVKQNEGHIHVYSEPGGGATFKIYLPRDLGEVLPGEDSPGDDPGVGGVETLLVVEDEPALLRIVEKALGGLGYEVLGYDSPEEALAVARENPGDIDLLLTDVVMPGMNGRELAEEIQAVRPGIQVLFMSGYTDRVMGRQGVLKDGMHFVQKPFSSRTLARRVREVLDG